MVHSVSEEKWTRRKHGCSGRDAVIDCSQRGKDLATCSRASISHSAGESRNHDSRVSDTNALDCEGVSAERTCMPTQRGYLSIQQRSRLLHAHLYKFIARLLARRLVWYARAINQYKHGSVDDKHCCEVHVSISGKMARRMHRVNCIRYPLRCIPFGLRSKFV